MKHLHAVIRLCPGPYPLRFGVGVCDVLQTLNAHGLDFKRDPTRPAGHVDRRSPAARERLITRVALIGQVKAVLRTLLPGFERRSRLSCVVQVLPRLAHPETIAGLAEWAAAEKNASFVWILVIGDIPAAPTVTFAKAKGGMSEVIADQVSNQLLLLHRQKPARVRLRIEFSPGGAAHRRVHQDRTFLHLSPLPFSAAAIFFAISTSSA